MARVSDFIPDGEVAVRLPTPVLGMHLLRLFIVGGQAVYGQLFHPENIYNPSVWAGHNIGADPQTFLRAMAEAWAWLESEAWELASSLRPSRGGSYDPRSASRSRAG